MGDNSKLTAKRTASEIAACTPWLKTPIATEGCEYHGCSEQGVLRGHMSSLRVLIGSFLNYPRISVTLAAIVCAFALPLSALDPNKTISQFTHTSWSAKDGIPGPVNAIAQTPDGYLWLGTPAGLYRFDGLHFFPWEAPSRGYKLPLAAGVSLFTACH